MTFAAVYKVSVEHDNIPLCIRNIAHITQALDRGGKMKKTTKQCQASTEEDEALAHNRVSMLYMLSSREGMYVWMLRLTHSDDMLIIRMHVFAILLSEVFTNDSLILPY